MAEKKWKEATIEYRNVAALRPAEPRAVKKLGLAYYENGQLGEAFPPLRALPRPEPERPRGAPEARRDLPDGPRARQGARAGRGDPRGRSRRTSTRCCCSRSPPTRRRRSRTRSRRLEQNRAALGDPDRVSRALGVLYARNQDVPRAEAEFKRRRELEAGLARGAPGARAAAPRQAGARPRRRRSSRRRPTSPPPGRSRGCSSPTSTCSRGASTRR